jgi:hypothetical protein
MTNRQEPGRLRLRKQLVASMRVIPGIVDPAVLERTQALPPMPLVGRYGGAEQA